MLSHDEKQLRQRAVLSVDRLAVARQLVTAANSSAAPTMVEYGLAAKVRFETEFLTPWVHRSVPSLITVLAWGRGWKARQRRGHKA